jgi:hypothetical protein
MRTEEQIRKKLAELNDAQKRYERSACAYHNGTVSREDYAKSVLRAQMKGLLFVLNERHDFLIAGDEDL